MIRLHGGYFWQRGLLAVLALLSLVPTFVHYRFVDHLLEATRYPYGLIPGHFIFLRSLAGFSTWLCAGIVAAVGWSFKRPASTPLLLTYCAAAAIFFLTAYTAYALFIVGVLLATRN